ncbi:hypothetical protein VAPA_1c46770 [Variovorax paradoxus B4]|uniref:Uncharacterized protein n=1 Tax=Variovorax paradoxus B4 TaxID=1246301 RepID=T1XHD6_VARPD|nr:hypothetical protein VAPA_1c46770 [Variovorax paradoxus B4]
MKKKLVAAGRISSQQMNACPSRCSPFRLINLSLLAIARAVASGSSPKISSSQL